MGILRMLSALYTCTVAMLSRSRQLA
jgi:hypothetical protein